MEFPSSPTNGQLFTNFGKVYEYSIYKSAWFPINFPLRLTDIIGVDETINPQVGDMIISDGNLLTSGTINGLIVYQFISQLPLSGNEVGALALVSENSHLYLWTGVGWFSVAIINESPTITTGPDATYKLNSDGTPIVITLVATDPEGIAITWSYNITSGALNNTTITNTDNVFTITPSTNPADAAEFTVTFTASDGLNLSIAESSFSLAFNTPMELASYAYAESIAAATGGTVITHDPAVSGTDLTWVLGDYNGGSPASPALPTLSNGDVLYLLPGAYTTTSWKTTYSASFFPRGHYSVIGADPNTVSIYVDDGANPVPRAESFFSYDNNGASLATYGTLQLNVGYLTLIQYAWTAINYQVPLVHGLGTQLDYITCKHVAFNRANATGTKSPLAWLYDNSNDAGTVRIEKCTFFNVSSLLGSYAGSGTNKTIDKCLISRDGAGSSTLITQTDTTTISDGITLDGFFATYDINTYTDRGHLILDNNSSTYTEPTAFG
jgi:hypothetical protein